MATLDIRNSSNSVITSIQWGSDDYVTLDVEDDQMLCVRDRIGDEIKIISYEVDDLIKALQKAKELWLDKK